jgi:RimJ/RimL family protein N-acetyltransferase
MKFVIETVRLRLAPLTIAQLRLLLEDPEHLEQEIGFAVSRDVVTHRVQRAIRLKLARMADIGEAHIAWYTYWLLVVTEPPFGAGLAGFKGFPDQHGEAEIGYGIDPRYQRQAYMTEAVRALLAWAFDEPACRAIVARDTKKWNIASQRVLAKVGMTVYDESEDAVYMRVKRMDPYSSLSGKK